MPMVDVCVKLGRRILQLRTEKGITQQALADLVGINRINMSRIERGIAEPGLRTLEKIAEGLDVKLSTLLEMLER